jgi:hypothetical protein
MKEAMFLCYSVTFIKKSVSSNINGMLKEVAKIAKGTRIFVARASVTPLNAFLKFFSRILNLLSDKETLKYVQSFAEFGFLYNAYIVVLYLNDFIRDLKFESPTQLEIHSTFFPRFPTDVL